MPSPITTGSFAKLLWPGINKIYGDTYNEYEPEYPSLFEEYGSDRAYEEDLGTTGFGLARIKNEAGSLTYDTESQAYLTRYVHVTYGLGFAITREAYEDDQYNRVGNKKAKGLAFSMRQTKEIVGANVYNRAANSSYTGGDGKELLATDHPNYAGGTWANEPSTAADLSEASLESAVIAISKFTNDRGLKIKVLPKKLIIPVDSMFLAHRILKSMGRVGTANNDANALKDMGMFQDYFVSHYITDTDSWFIRTSVEDGLKCFNRRKMEFGVDNEFDTENAKYKATERYVFGWTDPRCIYGSMGGA